MSRLFVLIITILGLCSCDNKVRHSNYDVGNEKERETVNWHIDVMIALGHYPDSINYDSFDPTFPAVFNKTDYNAVMYHRKYIDTIVLDDHTSRIYNDFFYLIDQNICLFVTEYLEYINNDYTKKYRE